MGPGWNATRGRFVLLRHEVPGEMPEFPEQFSSLAIQNRISDAARTPATNAQRSHWDLMLERGDRLFTMRLAELPAPSSALLGRFVDIGLRADRIVDHRVYYLDYEGEISGNRGSVTRWAAGRFCVSPHPECSPSSCSPESLPFPKWLMLHAPELHAVIDVASLPSAVDESSQLQIAFWQDRFSPGSE